MTKNQQLPVPTESAEQIALFQWAEWNAGNMPELALLYHIPNGGHRHKATAGRLRAEGVKSGVPDICLPIARGGYHGLYIELKRQRGNKATDLQEHWIGRLEREGYRAVVCFGWERAAAVLTEYLRLCASGQEETP